MKKKLNAILGILPKVVSSMINWFNWLVIIIQWLRVGENSLYENTPFPFYGMLEHEFSEVNTIILSTS